MKNIVLTGLSGSGKSTLGKMLANELGCPFIDLDSRIEEMTGMPIKKIFAGYGEDFFRDIETSVVQTAVQQQGAVIATGGGVVLRDENIALLKRNGFIVLVNRPVEHIAEDIQLGHRPLLAEGVEKLYHLAQQRERRYQQSADFQLHNISGLEDALQALLTLAKGITAEGYAVIGDPISHTLSPPIHTASFKEQSLSHSYTPIHVPQGKLTEFITGVKAGALQGFNVTIPHKQSIIPLLDEVDEQALQCSAVNTVVKRNGKLYGYNTDMGGLHASLLNVGHGFDNRHVLILGTGGSAAAVAYKAAAEGAASITIAGRHPHKADEIKSRIANQWKTPVSAIEMTPENLQHVAPDVDLLINCTPLGMQGVKEEHASFAFLKHLPKQALVCDLIYKPERTRLLREAEQQGLAVLNGFGMLVFQALLAQQHFLNQRLNINHLYNSVCETLNKNKESVAV